MAIVPPFQQKPIDPKSGFFTLPWVQWLLRCSDATNTAAPADAQYVLGAADAALTNGRVATNSASVTVNIATPNVITWTALGGTLFTTTPVTLTNAQIKAWADSSVAGVPAQGVGTRIVPMALELVTNFTAGAYTNVDPAATIYAALSSGETGYTDTLVNDASIPLTQVTTVFSATKSNVAFALGTLGEPVNNWGNIPYVATISAASYNAPLLFYFSNNSAGVLTGGNAANTLTYQIWYLVVNF